MMQQQPKRYKQIRNPPPPLPCFYPANNTSYFLLKLRQNNAHSICTLLGIQIQEKEE